MRINEIPDLNASGIAPDNPESPESGSGASEERTGAAQTSVGGQAAAVSAMLGNHKGKLAVGAAAMLGLAVFYKWRESKLAKEDPVEYARIQRLKAIVGSGDASAGDELTDPDQGNKE